jgi:Skp family chaperone for outer membrane proteins
MNMKRIFQSKHALTLVLAAGLVVMAGWAAVQQLQPAVVAVVDLEQLFNNLNEKADADAELKKMGEDADVAFAALRKEVEAMEQELESYDPKSASYADLSRRLTEGLTKLSAHNEITTQRIGLRQSRMMRTIYQRIKDATKAYASAHNIDAVFLDDTIPPLQEGSGQSVLQQISARRMIFVDRELDITKDILTTMNDAYGAARSAGATAPAAPTPAGGAKP